MIQSLDGPDVIIGHADPVFSQQLAAVANYSEAIVAFLRWSDEQVGLTAADRRTAFFPWHMWRQVGEDEVLATL